MIRKLLILTFVFSQVYARRFTVTNRCGWTVWPGIFGRNAIPLNGGFQLNSGESKNFDVPDDWASARIWPRTGCTYQNGRFVCETGKCKDSIGCSGSTGVPPCTLAEFNLKPNNDWYDISLVDGFNIPMSIELTNRNCKSLYCKSDINRVCPANFQFKTSWGKVVGCYTSCEKLKTDDQCCRGAHNKPETCPRDSIKTYWTFKNACPDAYAYAYDDKTSLQRCGSLTDYKIYFC